MHLLSDLHTLFKPFFLLLLQKVLTLSLGQELHLPLLTCQLLLVLESGLLQFASFFLEKLALPFNLFLLFLKKAFLPFFGLSLGPLCIEFALSGFLLLKVKLLL